MLPEIKKLFEKLSGIQRDIDASLDSPEVLHTQDLEELTRREHEVIHAIVLATGMPTAISRLKTAAVEAQEANKAYQRGEISLDVRNGAVRKALDTRDEMITLMNSTLQRDLQEYNRMVRSNPGLVAEFGIHEASTLCSVS